MFTVFLRVVSRNELYFTIYNSGHLHIKRSNSNVHDGTRCRSWEGKTKERTHIKSCSPRSAPLPPISLRVFKKNLLSLQVLIHNPHPRQGKQSERRESGREVEEDDDSNNNNMCSLTNSGIYFSG